MRIAGSGAAMKVTGLYVRRARYQRVRAQKKKRGKDAGKLMSVFSDP